MPKDGGIGASSKRREDVRFLTGAGNYTDDINMHGQAYVHFLRSDIAQNEILILQFSDEVDPATVNPSTIRLRTASGELPVGEFFVNGNQVEFVPTLSISGGQTFFGFANIFITPTKNLSAATMTLVSSASTIKRMFRFP